VDKNLFENELLNKALLRIVQLEDRIQELEEENKQLKTPECNKESQVRDILYGIDMLEEDGGWWPTSHGVAFGTNKLHEVTNLVLGLELKNAALRYDLERVSNGTSF
jgi:hypothetical protein